MVATRASAAKCRSSEGKTKDFRSAGLHEQQWQMMVQYFLNQHAAVSRQIPLALDRPLSPQEILGLRMYEGWR